MHTTQKMGDTEIRRLAKLCNLRQEELMKATAALGSWTKEAMPACSSSQKWVSTSRPVPPTCSPEYLRTTEGHTSWGGGGRLGGSDAVLI
jgi:hypothetical protein